MILIMTGCTLEATPFPTPDIPRVQFVSPANNSRVVDGTDLTIDIFGQDSSLGIAKIEFYANGSLIKEASLPNYDVQTDFRVQVNWLASGVGFHALSAIAYRPDGTRSDEAYLSIEVVSE
ncbi:MAG TPA: Ig-like domain-containing protein [Aggregatilineales bacterium]|nr:Ig-like domain-containing protein [Aggregatilineales bacterium]